MLYPPMSELLTHINSRYLLVNVVAHRAPRNIISPWRKSPSRWPSTKWPMGF